MPSPSYAAFAPTQWTIVLAAAKSEPNAKATHALAQLAQTYWFPLYACIRRHGRSPHQAEDLTQEFFARLLEKRALAHVDRAKGKFRSFLLASLSNFLANESDKARTQKRGGTQRLLNLDALAAEARYALEPADHMTPERLFEQRWAWAILDQVLVQLRDQYAAKGQSALFEALKSNLTSSRAGKTSYANLAKILQMPENSVAVAAHRLRRNYRDLLRTQIASTVADPALVDEEITYLLNSL